MTALLPIIIVEAGYATNVVKLLVKWNSSMKNCELISKFFYHYFISVTTDPLAMLLIKVYFTKCIVAQSITNNRTN